MKTASKSFPRLQRLLDPATNQAFTGHYDLFTVGAGYLDIPAALANTDALTGPKKTALSPLAVARPGDGPGVSCVRLLGSVGQHGGLGVHGGLGQLRRCGAPPQCWGTSVLTDAQSGVWGTTAVWGSTAVWGTNTTQGFTAVWGSTAVWGTSAKSGCAMLALPPGVDPETNQCVRRPARLPRLEIL